ncbi:hypothetical protein M408DRAFT_327525 [Serendipita vermifera MAFF 305830]|uniref:Inhibitor I9 domain-containing protein n=1 Tax=Serendipita vermifera MAFF 305830 TaxID=933852 RepID=A0A0C2WYU5_SERVB|nr:hypothetical protein M408DRAFT_327511 [Serendipita vermifera MAFF 305830]KIM31258.1 hypothetical protein M408DRAFT_327525 [Serendipita vermifera MAFF 305830]
MSHPRYIVVFKKTASKKDIEKYMQDVHAAGGKVTHDYTKAGGRPILNGFAAEDPSGYLKGLGDSLTASGFSNSPIEYIEPDGVATTQ